MTFDEPMSWSTVAAAFDALVTYRGPDLLRMKGILNVKDTDKPVVIHGVQHVFHPPATLAGWPDGDRRTRLVFITRDIEERTIRGLFDAFLGRPAPDQPDAQALTDNPLVPFGGRDR